MSVDIAAVLKSCDPNRLSSVVTDLCEIGAGTYGVVYKSLVSDSVPIAIKCAFPNHETDLEHESMVATQVADMEGFVRLCTKFMAPEPWRGNPSLTCGYVIPMLAYEYIEGITMQEWVSGCTDRQLVDVLIAIFTNMDRAYEQCGLVHCDLRLDNIMITKDDKPVIIDLGVSTVRIDGNVIHSEQTFVTKPWIDASILFQALRHYAPDAYYRCGLNLVESFLPVYCGYGSVKKIELADDYSHKHILDMLKNIQATDEKSVVEKQKDDTDFSSFAKTQIQITTNLDISQIHDCETQEEYNEMMNLWHGYLMSMYPHIPADVVKEWNRAACKSRDIYGIEVYFLG